MLEKLKLIYIYAHSLNVDKVVKNEFFQIFLHVCRVKWQF